MEDKEIYGIFAPGVEVTDSGTAGGKDAKKPPAGGGGGSRQWVIDLQTAIKKKYPETDLGKTGKNKDGIDGGYGNLTKGAVKTIAEKLKVEPFKSDGTPSDDFNKAMGIGTAKEDGAKKESGDKAEAEEDLPPKLASVQVRGAVFDLNDFMRALPPSSAPTLTESGEQLLDPREAYTRLTFYGRAVAAGGIAPSKKMPTGFTQAIAKAGVDGGEAIEAFKQSAEAYVTEVKGILEDVGAAVKQAIRDKRKELGLDGEEPVQRGTGKQAYDYEWHYYRFLDAITNGVETAFKALQAWLISYMPGFESEDANTPQNPRSLLQLMRTKTQTLTGVDKNALTEAHAKAVGLALKSQSVSRMGRRILKSDPGQYDARNDNAATIDRDWVADVSRLANVIKGAIDSVKGEK